MGEEVNMADYASGSGSGDDDRVFEWESGLPGADDLTPLSQFLIPPELAMAFNIKPERIRTLFDVNRASEETLSGLRLRQLPTFAGNDADGSRDLVMVDDDDEEDDDERSDSRKLRRIDSAEEADSALQGENSISIDDQSAARTLKKARLVWTPQLHKRFVDVVSHLGIKTAVPKTIMQLMNVEGLTRENVASHLQKYRLYLKRMQGLSNEGPSPSDPLFASTPIPHNLNESGRNGHMPMQVPMPYGPVMVPMPVYGHGHMGMPMGAHHQHAYSMMQGNCNGSVMSYPHATRSDK